MTGIPRHIAVSSGLVQQDAPYLQKPANFDLLASTLHGLLNPYVPDREAW